MNIRTAVLADIEEIYNHRTLGIKGFYRNGILSIPIILGIGYVTINEILNPWIAGILLWAILFALNNINTKFMIVRPIHGIVDF